MKSNQIEDTDLSSDLALNNQNLNHNLTKRQIQCQGTNQAILFCSNEHCKQQSIFICGLKKCKCYKKHNACSTAQLQYVLDFINQKIVNLDEIKQQIQQVFDRICDNVNNLRDQLKNLVDQRFKLSLLYKQQARLYLISLNQIEQSKINSTDGAIIWKVINLQNRRKHNLLEKTKQILNLLQQTSAQCMENAKAGIQMILTNITEQKQKRITKTLISLQPQIQNDSLFRLLNFFPQKIKKLKLIYQASKNNFSLPTYYKLHGSQANTVIVALTEGNKLFGGFNPFSLRTGKDQWIHDRWKKSFLFSLSQNQKFQIVDQYSSIYRFAEKSHLIQFGQDFCLFDSANTNKNCRVGYSHNYKNPKYINDKQSYLKLNRTQSDRCIMKQWQIYSVQF